MMNCVLILIGPLALVDDLHRFWLYGFESVDIDVIHEIRNLFLARQVVLSHPPSLIFHGEDEGLVKR